MLPTLIPGVSTYGVLVAAGYGAAIWWLSRRRAELGLSEERFWELIYWLFGGALLGGKLGFALVERDVSVLWTDLRYGFVFYGGFLGAVAAGWLLARRRGFPFWRLADYFGAALPLGHAIGRIGCLAAGCCYGRHTELPWGLPMAGDPSRHPTQLYEAAANALIAFAVLRYLPRRRRDGDAFVLYIALYAVARFAIEFFRADDRGFSLAGLSPSQLIALLILSLCAYRLK